MRRVLVGAATWDALVDNGDVAPTHSVATRVGASIGEVTVETKTTKLLQQLKQTLYQIYGENLRGLYLYGSYANQEQDAESDVDVVIVLKGFRDYWEEVQRTSLIISELSLRYDVSISPVRIREIDWVQEDSAFLNNVRKECIPL